MDENPQEIAADSPNLFLLDTRTTDSKPPNPGRKPAKLMEINIPLCNPTQPTLVTGKTAERRDNADLSGPSVTTGHVMLQQLRLGMRILGLRPYRPLTLLIIPPMPT